MRDLWHDPLVCIIVARVATPNRAFSSSLINWYQQVGRDLPWRHHPTPYEAWVAEVMLQQTQVDTVLRYYHSFLSKFSTIRALARAELSQVLKAWEGMGYYARCRNMHRSAGICVEQHRGQFPVRFEDALALPGIGRSTAGAILTFGCGQAHPILDGNVKRVLVRLENIDEDPSRGPVQRKLWESSATLLAATMNPFDHNQAMMELGALLCLPRKPHCDACPVRSHCLAYAAGTQAQLPVKKQRKAIPHRHIAVGVVFKRGRLLMQQRALDGMLGGLWEFPGGPQRDGEPLEETLSRAIQEELGVVVRVGEKLATVRHAFSHFTITLHAYRCRFVSGRAIPQTRQACKWVAPTSLSDHPLPRASQRVLEVALDAQSSSI